MNFRLHVNQGQGKRKQWRWYLKEDTVDERTRVNGPIYGWETEQGAEDDFKEITDFIVKKYGGPMAGFPGRPWLYRVVLPLSVVLNIVLFFMM